MPLLVLHSYVSFPTMFLWRRKPIISKLFTWWDYSFIFDFHFPLSFVDQAISFILLPKSNKSKLWNVKSDFKIQIAKRNNPSCMPSSIQIKYPFCLRPYVKIKNKDLVIKNNVPHFMLLISIRFFSSDYHAISWTITLVKNYLNQSFYQQMQCILSGTWQCPPRDNMQFS